jgi:CPA2 family monovalent cation:H+ antiporter-2
MNPNPRLIVATDLSEPSLHAVDRAWRIARDGRMALTLMHALELESIEPLARWLGPQGSGLRERLHQAATTELMRIAGARGDTGAGLVDVQVVDGVADDEIHRLGAAIDPALLVLGAHGRGFMRRLVMGSTASRVLRRSRYPVLLAKQPCRGPYRRVLVAIDFSPASIQALRLARWLAPAADVVLLHVYDVPFAGMLHVAGVDDATIEHYLVDARASALRRVHEEAAAAGLSTGDYAVRVAVGDPARQVLAAEHEADCDLVAIGKHGRHALEELLLGSVATHVLAESRGDVLVVPAPGAAA